MGPLEWNMKSEQDNIINILLVYRCYVTNVIVVYYRTHKRTWTKDVDDVDLLYQGEEVGVHRMGYIICRYNKGNNKKKTKPKE